MERMWQERADYGHFFYRIPNGESAADAYDRVSGFNESLWRQFGEDDFASVCVLVTHGLMSRVFLMKWYHFTVEYFEDLRNIDHCEFLIMRKQDNGKYNLDTKLRTWSELKRERAALKEKEKEKGKNGEASAGKDEVKLQRNKTFVVTRRWGGCPDGCNHTSKYLKRHDLESLRQKDIEQAALSSHKSATAPQHPRHRTSRVGLSSDDDDDEHTHNGAASASAASAATSADKKKPVADTTRSTASARSKTLRLNDDSDAAASSELALKSPPCVHLGRDFGGSYSGHTSVVDSDSDSDNNHKHDDADSDSELVRPRAAAAALHHRRRRGSILNSIEARLLQATITSHNHARQRSVGSVGSSAASPGIGPFVNRLGDAPPLSDSEGDVAKKQTPAAAKVPVEVKTPGEAAVGSLEDLEAAEAADRSIEGSVY